MVNKVGDEVQLSKVDKLEVLFVNDVDYCLIVDECNVLSNVEKVLAIVGEALLDLLQL